MTDNTHSNKKKSVKKPLLIIVGSLLAIILIAVVVVASITDKNVKAMNQCVDSVLATLDEHYMVTPVDIGDSSTLSIYGIMNFDVEQYDIKDIGNLSIMRMNMGVMQMATIVITPQDKNLPLLSADYMYILANRKAYLEFYDVVKEKDSVYTDLLGALQKSADNYSHLEDITPSEAWYEHLLTVTTYKSGSFDADKDLEKLLTDSLNTYLTHAKKLPLLSDTERQEKLAITVEYTDGLIEKGGVSTDVFKDALGEEATKQFFDDIFFGTNTL